VSPRLSLELVGGPGAPTELPRKGKLVIGADAGKVGLVIDGQGVAGVHCAIGRVKGGGWALKDMGSEYGTLVNGQRVAATRLAAGDVVMLGSRRLRVVDPEQPADAPGATDARAAGAAPASSPPPAPPAGSDTSRRRTPLLKPEVPGYTIERELGRGSSGVVWLAVQDSLHRKVALKVLSPQLAGDATFVRRFQAEARAAAALNHPNVVHAYDVGEAGGHHFLSMEFMSMGCLESRLGALGPIPWREALEILIDATKGLVYAESRGIVHRDIKPANLMQNEDGTTKIADLGLAVEVEQRSLEQTSERKVLGTPHFIAPELIRGGVPDARSDLYSLGATAYRLLSGHTPFEGERSTDILRAALIEEPPPLGERVLGLPPAVAFCVHRLLAKDPSARHPSAAVLLAELERLRAGEFARPAPPGLRRAGAKPSLAWIAVLGLALVGALAWALRGNGDGGGDGGDAPVAPEGGGGPDALAGGAPDGGTGGPLIPVDDRGAPAVPVVDDDQAEQAFEDEAELALRRLLDTQHGEQERIAALRELAQRFPGTTAATTALADAAALDEARRAAASARQARDAARATLLAALREAAELDADPPRAGHALRNMEAVPGQAELEADGEFVAARQALVDEVLDRALAHAEATWTSAEELEQAGDFDALGELLTTFIGTVDFPEYENGGAPPQLASIRAIAARARDKHARREELRLAYLAEQRVLDRARLAAGFGGPAGLEAELRAFDLAGAAQRLARLDGELRTDEGRARLAPLLADLPHARAALASLTAGWTADTWKRRTVLDPRSRKPGSIEAVGADAEGLLVAASGPPERLRWGTFAGSTQALNHLFHERLEAGWSADELVGIALLLRVSAVIEAIDAAAAMLAPDAASGFGAADEEALLAGFELAARWAEQAGQEPALARERRAAVTLARALRAASDGRWAEAETLLERLLTEGDESLLVSLLSDGGE
jgi:hypothetical protein